MYIDGFISKLKDKYKDLSIVSKYDAADIDKEFVYKWNIQLEILY